MYNIVQLSLPNAHINSRVDYLPADADQFPAAPDGEARR